MEKISYAFNHKEYTFQGECIYPQKGQMDYGKRIYRGNFVGANPYPRKLFSDQEYILIQITVDEKTIQASNLPQSRQYWDAALFEGEHLRRILGRNDAAGKLAVELRDGYSPVKGVYQFIEPEYLPIGRFLESMSSFEKLDLMEQSCCALEEFCSFSFPSKIIAHRDIKTANLMIEPMTDRFRVRLIDYASLCRSGGDGTLHGGVSPANTAPEVVGLEETGFKVCDRTDVFALGGILAELFGSCNPISLWSREFWPRDAKDVEKSMNQLRKAYRSAMKTYAYLPDTTSWLEEELKSQGFHWNSDLPGDLLERIKRLFRSMIPINPKMRVSLAQAHETLRSLMMELENRNLAIRKCSGIYLRNSIFLFDRRLLSRHRLSYLPAIRDVWDNARRMARRKGCAGVRITWMAYGWVDEVAPETVNGQCKRGEAASAEEMIDQLEEIADEQMRRYSLLELMLHMAEKYLHSSVYTMTDIHVFAPDDCADCPEDWDIEQTVENLSCGYRVNLVLHSVQAGDDKRWYSHHDALNPPSRLWDQKVSQAAKQYVPPHKISMDADAWFIQWRNQKVYVGKRV